MRTTRGFTLLEMLVVMAVLGVVASMTLPDLTPVVRRTEMRGSTGDVVAVLERARREARSSGRCIRVRLDAGSLALEGADGARCDGTFDPIMRIRPGNAVSFAMDSSTASVIAFVANGRLLGDGDTEVEDDGARVRITSSVFPNQNAVVGVTSAGLVCTRLMSVVPAFEPSRVCVEEGAFFGAHETDDGEVELGDGDGLGGGGAGGEGMSVVNFPELPSGGGEEGGGEGGEEGGGGGEAPPVEPLPEESPPAEPVPEESPPAEPVPDEPPPAEPAPSEPPPSEPAAEEPPPAEAPPPTEEAPPPAEEGPPATEENAPPPDSSGSDTGLLENVEGGPGANLSANSGSGFEA